MNADEIAQFTAVQRIPFPTMAYLLSGQKISELTCRKIIEAAISCGSQDDISILFGV